MKTVEQDTSVWSYLDAGMTTEVVAALTGWPRRHIVEAIGKATGWHHDQRNDKAFFIADPGRRPEAFTAGRMPTAVAKRLYLPGIHYDPTRVRAWAQTHGYTVAETGDRLPGSLVQQYIDDNGGISQ